MTSVTAFLNYFVILIHTFIQLTRMILRVMPKNAYLVKLFLLSV